MSSITQELTKNYLTQLSTIAQAVDLVEKGKKPTAGFFVYADRFHTIQENLAKGDKEKLPEELKKSLSSLSERMTKISANALGPELQQALRSDQAETAAKIFRISNPASTPLPNGELPANYAIRCGSRVTMQRLIRDNLLDLKQRDHQNLTIMDHALLSEDREMAKLLLRALLPSVDLSDEVFASLGIKSKKEVESAIADFQPLIHIAATSLPAPHQAAFLGDRKKLETLAATSPHFNTPLPAWVTGNAESEMTPWHLAALGQQPAILEFLLEQGCNPKALTGSGKNALHLAVIRDDYSTVKKILELQGCEIDLPDRTGMTPLRYAIQTQNLKIISLLVSKGADISRQVKGVTLLEMLWHKLKEGAALRDPLTLDSNLLARLAISGVSKGLGTLHTQADLQGWLERNRFLDGAVYAAKEIDFSFPFLNWNWRNLGVNGSSLYDLGWNLSLGAFYSGVGQSWAPLRLGGHALRGLISAVSAYRGIQVCWRNRHCEWKRPLLRGTLHLLDIVDSVWKIGQSGLAIYMDDLQPEEDLSSRFWTRWNPKFDESNCPKSLTPAEEQKIKKAADTIAGCFDGVIRKARSHAEQAKVRECLQSNMQLLHDSWKDLEPRCPIHARAILEQVVETPNLPAAGSPQPQAEEGISDLFSSIMSSIIRVNDGLSANTPRVAAKHMFRALSLSLHPDKLQDPGLKALSQAVNERISTAYATLTS